MAEKKNIPGFAGVVPKPIDHTNPPKPKPVTPAAPAAAADPDSKVSANQTKKAPAPGSADPK